MIYFDSQQYFEDKENIEQLDGKLGSQNEEDKLMHSVLQEDKKTIDNGKLINEALNQGISSLTPDLMFQQMVSNFSMAQQIYGPSLLKLVSGYNPDYLKRNINIPEFQKELKSKIEQNIQDAKDQDMLDREFNLTDTGIDLAAHVMYFEELDKLTAQGLIGEKRNKKTSHYGAKDDYRAYKKGDRYRDLSLKKSAKKAIRRGHKELSEKDLVVFERESKGHTNIIYALDASGSMKGKKIEACKKAGVALSYKALEEKDKVGLIVFGSEIKNAIAPTDNFPYLLHNIARIKASRQTDMLGTIRKAIELFPNNDAAKHLILITDAVPNVGKDPQKETLKEVSNARNSDITISLVGINLDKDARKLAEKIVELGQGKLYAINNVDQVDRIILEEYDRLG